MNIVGIVAIACISLALIYPVKGCSSDCCKSCKPPRCMREGGNGRTFAYFPKDGVCKKYSSERGCPGRFYGTEPDCNKCCKSKLRG
uniref:Putative secreted protein n=1 Tax=Amblyomma americanum TaxID=6943 RepID=A0A0C9SCQ9_AMBAM